MLSVFLEGPALAWYESHYGNEDAHTRVELDQLLIQLEEQFGSNKQTFIDVETLLDRPQRPGESFDLHCGSLTDHDEFKYFFKNVLQQYRRPLLVKDIQTVQTAAEVIRKEINTNKRNDR